MNVFSDPVLLKSLERILLAVAAAYLGFLGYKLFLYGIASGRSVPNRKLQVTTAFYSGVAPGLFFIAVAGLVVVIVSLTGNPPVQPTRPRPSSASAIRANERAELLRQIALLKQTDNLRQGAIRDLRNQLAAARTNNVMTEAVVEQLQQSVSAAGPSIDYNAIYTQMQELSDTVDELQTENETLRTENTALRAQSSQNNQQ